MRKGRNVAPISIYASMEETLNDTFNTGTNKELIPSAKPQVKNISPKNDHRYKETLLFFHKSINNTFDEYYYICNMGL